MRTVMLALSLVALVAAAGCSSKSQPRQSTTHASAPPSGATHADGGADDAAADASAASADDAGDDGSANDGHLCVILANSGPSVRESRIASDAPQPTGGAIAPGTYELVAFNTYTGSGGPTGTTARTYAETLMFDGVDWEEVVQQTANGGNALNAQPMASSGTYSADGNTLTMTITCPTYAGATFTYSAVGPELHIYSEAVERVFRMQ